MSKKEGKGLKSFNKGFQVPDTYIIIFLVVVVAALLTFLVPKGFYETQDISYMINGVEKTRTVIKDGSFQYLTDDSGNVVTEGVALFSGDGGTGIFNYMYNGIVNSSAIEIIAFLMVVGGAFGIMIRTGAIESGLIGLIRKAKGAEKLLIPVLFILFSRIVIKKTDPNTVISKHGIDCSIRILRICPFTINCNALTYYII